MKLQNVFFTALFALALFSCGKDDGPTTTNGAPTMSAQAFTASEGISDTQAIGTVKATDPDGDALAFAIVANSGDLFEIAATTGSISLASGKSLDFGLAASHVITVGVSDGEDDASAQITINVTNVNSAPVVGVKAFSVPEDAVTVGNIGATDPDGDELTFAIVENDSDLFTIGGDGEISLADGKNLDFETATLHSITVSVTDGVETVEAGVNINVENVAESLAEDPASFITTWKTDADGQEIIIAPNNLFTYDYKIDWGDGTVEDIATADQQSHVYVAAGTYTVAIKGQFPAIQNSMIELNIRKRLASIEQWGDIAWKSFRQAFIACSKMEYNATDVPDLSQVTDMGVMFADCTNFNGDLSGWDVSGITNMMIMFASATSFNGDISGWDTGNITNMSSMFNNAPAFDQDLGGWNISKVTDMGGMLSGSGMSPENYSATLIGWSSNGEKNIPDNIELGAVGLTFCNNPATLTAKTVLIGQNTWTIDDNGSVDCN
ncbi:hypothetical protein HME9304_01530 [Flagellimonas maritima]|uniref:BspA family leucine-rich repeat surface protein n=1 Tax=Flagellimonas maritima TaxID=1383885 RepID=A0A2Z4LTB4_9FLAO|nr:BspA family leucine-rich repeat surface protein [Allomuricauda aurantiaca]AWX44527.1 hypothetical protein HME9304_01530 [Allomuricauda aurantiaca]